MTKFAWTDETLTALDELHAANASHAEIAEHLGCSKATVSRKLAALREEPVGFAPCQPAAPCAPAAQPAPADEQPAEEAAPARAPHAPATAPETPAPCQPKAAKPRSRVDVTVDAMRRPEGVTVVELAALFEAEFDGNGKLSTASQAIYKAPAARKLVPTNTGEKREGRAVYRILD